MNIKLSVRAFLYLGVSFILALAFTFVALGFFDPTSVAGKAAFGRGVYAVMAVLLYAMTRGQQSRQPWLSSLLLALVTGLAWLADANGIKSGMMHIVVPSALALAAGLWTAYSMGIVFYDGFVETRGSGARVGGSIAAA